MNHESFSFQTLNNLNLAEGKEYITKFFIPLTNGDHVYISNKQIEIMKTSKIKNVYFKRMHKDLSNFYFNEYHNIRTPVNEMKKPFLFDDKINFVKPFIP